MESPKKQNGSRPKGRGGRGRRKAAPVAEDAVEASLSPGEEAAVEDTAPGVAGAGKRNGAKDGSGGAHDAGNGSTPESRKRPGRDVREAMAIFATAQGAPLAEAAGNRPQVDLTAEYQSISREFGELSRGSDLFRMGDGFVTVDERTGEVRAMTPDRFKSWAEPLAWTYKPAAQGDRRFTRIGRELAATVLSSDRFREHVRELAAVNTVRLPIYRGDGESRRIELLPEGYDEDSGIFTAETVGYDTRLGLRDAMGWLLAVIGEYPWWEREAGVKESRSAAAHVAAMLSAYVRHLLPRSAKRPLVVYNGNRAGTGKSTLARMAVAPVFGEVDTSGVDQNPDELRKRLDTAALERQPFLLLDDVTSLRSPELNAFITSGSWRCRLLGQSRTEKVPIVTQVFASGNMLRLTEDLMRRCLPIDLFLAGDLMNRRFDLEITDEWVVEHRAEFLAALWAVVSHWNEQGRPVDREAYRPSFEAYARLVGSIVLTAGLANPFAAREASMGGDEPTEALVEVLCRLADRIPPEEESPEISPTRIVAMADHLGTLDTITNYVKDHAKAMGWRIKRLQGREFRDGFGRLFAFGNRKTRAGKVYPIKFLSELQRDWTPPEDDFEDDPAGW